MESAAEGHNLAELQIIAPMLESIADDTTILNIARQRAKNCLPRPILNEIVLTVKVKYYQ